VIESYLADGPVLRQGGGALYHDQDPAGVQRKQFVQDQLRVLGVEVTEAVINMIEGTVWEINTENKKAQVQTKELDAMAENLGETVVRETTGRIRGDGNGNG